MRTAIRFSRGWTHPIASRRTRPCRWRIGTVRPGVRSATQAVSSGGSPQRASRWPWHPLGSRCWPGPRPATRASSRSLFRAPPGPSWARRPRQLQAAALTTVPSFASTPPDRFLGLGGACRWFSRCGVAVRRDIVATDGRPAGLDQWGDWLRHGHRSARVAAGGRLRGRGGRIGLRTVHLPLGRL